MLGNHVILQLKYNEKLDFTELPSFSSKPTYNSIFNSVNSRSSVTILFFLWTSPPIWQVVTCKCNRHLQTPVNLEYPLEYESATELSEKSKIYVKKMTCTSARVYHSFCGMVQQEVLILWSGWDARPTQIVHLHFVWSSCIVLILIYFLGWRVRLWHSCVLPENTVHCDRILSLVVTQF